ncbi:MAG: prepilin-type N-terminal cleavage/methylation domain-containing protein [Pseudohongiellaceae bacterium]|jgi:prepilin-type N-terminal cleavage/methylation domain-containing protein
MKNSLGNMKQQGFTLIEIAIVLVIIGLLVGGVLQGQQLIENSRIKQAVKDINGTTIAMLAYQDRYGSLPGDDASAAAARGSAWATGIVAGNGNGTLNASRGEIFRGRGNESTYFWQHLKAAGFIGGDPADTGVAALPNNAWGGFMGVTVDPVYNNMIGTKVCLSNVAGTSAAGIDSTLDDGNGRTGSVRSDDGTNLVPGTGQGDVAYNEDLVYTLCYRM